MDRRNFVATVKEGDVGAPCSINFEANDDVGINMRTIVLKLRPGTDIDDARTLAYLLNGQVLTISADDYTVPSAQVHQ